MKNSLYLPYSVSYHEKAVTPVTGLISLNFGGNRNGNRTDIIDLLVVTAA